MKLGVPTRLPRFCPHSTCKLHREGVPVGPTSRRFVRRGFYWRADDSRWIARFQCLGCRRSFSRATLSPAFGQRRRHANARLRALLCSGVSQRRAARLLGLDRKTVERKLLWLARQAQAARLRELERLGREPVKLTALHFDEMESFERSKCLPLSIPLAVLPGSRKILSFRVASMPANGPLAELSRRRYGPRADGRRAAACSLLAEIGGVLSPDARITTDQNPKYPGWLRPHFPRARHVAVEGQRGCVGGQGELKRIGHDPLFDLNHTAAMKRANINRLFRRTWCTTKRADRLAAHIEVYAQYHNEVLTDPEAWHAIEPSNPPRRRGVPAPTQLDRAGSPD
jgi:transposase-like protein